MCSTCSTVRADMTRRKKRREEERKGACKSSWFPQKGRGAGKQGKVASDLCSRDKGD